MSRRLVYGSLLLLLGATSAFATDYDLVISENASGVKSAGTIQVYDPSGRLQKGDKIISVLYDQLPGDGLGCSVALGGGAPVKASMAAKGEATGVVGEIQLAGAGLGRRGFKAALIELPPHPANTDDKSMARKALVDKATSLPWLWIGGGVALLFVVFTLIRKSGGNDAAPIFYSAGKGMREATHEIKDRLDKIESAQHRLVKDPPVLRRFNAQINGFDQRLRQIESSLASIERGLGTLYSSIGVVNGQVGQVLGQQEHAQDSVKGLSQAVSQLSGDTYRRFDEAREQLKSLAGTVDKLTAMPSRLDSVETQAKSAGQAAEAIVPRIDGVQKELASASSAQAELRQQIGQLAERLNELQGLAAPVQALSGQVDAVGGQVDALGAKLDSVSAQAASSEAKLDLMPGLLSMLNEEIDRKLSALRGDFATELDARPVVHQVVEAARPEPVAVEPEPLAPEPVAGAPVIEEPAPQVEPEIPEPPADEPEAPVEAVAEEAPVIADDLTADDEMAEAEAPVVAEEEHAEVAAEVTELEELIAAIEPEPEHPVIEISAEPAHEEDENEVSAHVGGGRWSAEGGSSERLWSTEFSRPINFMQSSSHIRPLTPMDTPSISSPIGAMVYANGRVAYAHGDVVRAFWPGKEERVASLVKPMPCDAWRMLVHDSQIFCVEDGAVEMVNTNSWSSQGRFDGNYLNQLHTGRHWAGLLNKGGQLAVELRSDAGTLAGQAFDLEIDGGEPYLAASSSEHLFVASGSGNVFRVGVEGAAQVASVGGGQLLQLSATNAGLLAILKDGDEVRTMLFGSDGALIREGSFTIPNPFETSVVMGGKLYVVAQEPFEIHTINLKAMKHAGTRPLPDVNRLRRLGGIRHGSHHMLMMAVDDSSNHNGHVSLLSLKTGDDLRLCSLNHKHVDLLAADHHVVLATSCSYQNIIQVFEPFTARDSLRDVA